MESGRLIDAESFCNQILAVAPDNPDLLYLAGVTARALGKKADAVHLLSRAAAVMPNNPSFHCTLGVSLNEDGQTEASIAALERAIVLEPRYADAYNNLGFIHMLHEQDALAEPNLRKAILLEPNFALAYANLGVVLARTGRKDEAESCLRKSLALDPHNADAYNNLGSILLDRGQLAEAANNFQQAIRANPRLTLAYLNLGTALQALGNPAEAIQCAQSAIQIEPTSADAYATLAAAQKAAGQVEQSIQSAEHALRLNPKQLDAYRILGAALEHVDRNDEAVECYRKAQAVASHDVEFRFREMAAGLPRLADSDEEIRQLRAKLLDSMEQLSAIDGKVDHPEGATFTLFPLAYHGENDRPLHEQAARLVRSKIPSLQQTMIKGSLSADGRIRVGFISSLFRNHTISKLNIGYIRHLDRSRFHVTVIHGPGRKADHVSAEIDALADAVEYLPQSLDVARQRIADLSLDVLHYADIGMTPMTNFLAHARLAPVQTVSWGHPVTTGLDSIDYFLSFDPAEPEGAESHYSEQLVRLKRAPAYYEPVVRPSTMPSRAALGLPAEGRLYGCLQSLFKFHHEFDAVLADITARDPQAWIVAIASEDSRLQTQLRKRWSGSYPNLVERVAFVPPVSGDDFIGLIGNMDVLLDTPHFGSGNTFYESMSCGVPTVTWPGYFMRGRLVAAFYHWLGIEDAPIAASLDDYGQVAVALATDTDRLDRLRWQLREKAGMIFSDILAVRELEEFFVAATEAVRR